jgi:cytidyltransferase-like protein
MDTGAAIEFPPRWNDLAVVNGCFDPPTPGHAELVHEATKLTPLVVVLMNSDRWVRDSKPVRPDGRPRPFMPFLERAYIVGRWKGVAAVIEFGTEDELLSQLSRLRPRYLVKGNDYIGKPVTGALILPNWGGELVFTNRSYDGCATKLGVDTSGG